MYCVECGSKIEERYKFCPNCGAEVVDDPVQMQNIGNKATGSYSYCANDNYNKDDSLQSKEELERIGDEVVLKYPIERTAGINEFKKIVGCDLKFAREFMSPRYSDRATSLKLADEKEARIRTQLSSGICPNCGSDNLECTKLPDVSSTLSYIEGVYRTTHHPGKTKIKCRVCKKKWKI